MAKIKLRVGMQETRPVSYLMHLTTFSGIVQFIRNGKLRPVLPVKVMEGTGKLEAVTYVGRELLGMERHSEEKNGSDIYENCIRLRYIGKRTGKWVNGLLVKGYLNGLPTHFLIDRRSTSTILPCDKCLNMDDDKKPPLEQTHLNFLDVNGNQLRVHGCFSMPIALGSSVYRKTVVVCDISLYDIIGEDFLMKQVCKLDHKSLLICIGYSDIQCYIRGEVNMVIHVVVKVTITVLPQSRMWIQVINARIENLTDKGTIETSPKLWQNKKIAITRGRIH
ncbi:hypothetical protein CHS0354_001359 [Potamilus streckersoni]|uniref:Uncharacterized protein n=1 Tax=Potamilus streckersoni TaxID=2493646 RepID=A0AAE0TGV4_9BIVA|nr:hypothetical protein CHS0354_001359 [Potamilus streckersoni]